MGTAASHLCPPTPSSRVAPTPDVVVKAPEELPPLPSFARSTGEPAAPPSARAPPAAPRPTTPAGALLALKRGNRRFMHGVRLEPGCLIARRVDIGTHGQRPWAVIITCSDSRVSPEIIFDAGLGDVFVVRTAGHVLEPCAIASVEYAVSHLGCLVVVVVGHERCGAIAAAVAAHVDAETAHAPQRASRTTGSSEGGSGRVPPSSSPLSSRHANHMAALVASLIPAVCDALVTRCPPSYSAQLARGDALSTEAHEELIEASVRSNAVRTVQRLLCESPLLARAVEGGSLLIRAWRYDIDSPPDEDEDAITELDGP